MMTDEEKIKYDLKAIKEIMNEFESNLRIVMQNRVDDISNYIFNQNELLSKKDKVIENYKKAIENYKKLAQIYGEQYFDIDDFIEKVEEENDS